MLRLPGVDQLVGELRGEFAAQRALLDALVRQTARELTLADMTQAPPSPHTAPVVIQATTPALGAVVLADRLPQGRYAQRGYVANQDPDGYPLWLKVVTPSGSSTLPFLVAAGDSWAFPCNVAEVHALQPDGVVDVSARWQILAQ